jgi:hypothetical protein
LDPTADFGEGRLHPIPVSDAIHRVQVFCTSPRSGFGPYDMAAVAAREAGHFHEVAPWSLLWADALAGRLSVDDLAAFTPDRRHQFAELIAAIDPDVQLGALTEEQRASVSALCCFGFPGAWAPKITKVAALYRPHAVPVLDGYMAMAFGYSRDAFSVAGARRERIQGVVDALAKWLAGNAVVIKRIRYAVSDVVPAIHRISDVRLVDIIIWTAQDDRLTRPGKAADAWLNGTAGEPIVQEHWEPVRLS